MNSKSIGRRIKAYRAKCGLDAEECSIKIGISERYLYDIECGNKTPKLETFIRILNVLSASADDILQDNLSIGYQAKSNEILTRMEALNTNQKNQALYILDSIISSFKID